MNTDTQGWTWSRSSGTMWKLIVSSTYRIYKNGSHYNFSFNGDMVPGLYATIAAAQTACHEHARSNEPMPEPTDPYLTLATRITDALVLALEAFAQWYPCHAGKPVLTAMRDWGKNEMEIKRYIDDHNLWIAPAKGAPEE